ncbi:endonuclease VIII [Clostridium sp. 'deep sea']|nr:endonuclease VIII [Clostridium sp. 'deep sea']
MIEIPEALVIAKQLKETIVNKRICDVIANSSPHKFAWFYGDPIEYKPRLVGKTIKSVQVHGSRIDVNAEDIILDLCEGVNIRYTEKISNIPKKHQLLIKFCDDTYLYCTIQMYGGIFAFEKGSFDNIYYKMAQEKPSPISNHFTLKYFLNLFNDVKQTISTKAFIATEQRIPGLGNGCLQDILFAAQLHPKRKINTLTNVDKELLFKSIKSTIAKMTNLGGRDSEKDIFGEKGRYNVIMGRKNVNQACPACGNIIKKASYLGGSIYYCDSCQPL